MCANKIILQYDLIGHLIGKRMILLERCLMDSQRSPHVRETSKGVQPQGGGQGGVSSVVRLAYVKVTNFPSLPAQPSPSVAISYPGPLN
jgi:hypothetical protein